MVSVLLGTVFGGIDVNVAMGCGVGCWVFVAGVPVRESCELLVGMLVIVDVVIKLCVGIMTVSTSVLLGVVSLILV
tara:strand:- start:1265 stop:1492 length:228 start_codon:yes stop_codon:yes gene_type:complete